MLRLGALLLLTVSLPLAQGHAEPASPFSPPSSPDEGSLGQKTGTLAANRPTPAASPVGPASADQGVAPGPDGANPITKLGIFTLTPGVTAGSFFDDNVFATNAFRRSDFAFFARPELSASASGSTYGILASAFVEGRKYAQFSSEDQVNGGASVAGVYQPDATTQVKAQAEYLHGHEDRGLGESAFIVLDRPVAFDQVDGAVALNKRFDRYWASLGASALGVFYQNDSLAGAPINETYRNAAIPTVTGRVGYVVAPLTSVFADVTGNARNFDYTTMNSTGYRAVGGLLFEPGPGARVKGEVFGGYMHQDYVGPGVQTIDSWTYGSSIGFLITNVLTFTVEGRRGPGESGLFGGSLIQNQLAPTGAVSLIESTIGGRFDYQVANNVVVSAGVTYLDDSFKGIAENDRYISPSASINWTVSKHIGVGLDYRHLEYLSDIAGVPGFQKDVVLASMHAAF